MAGEINATRTTTPENIVGVLRNVGSGRGIVSTDIDENYHLVITYTDGEVWVSDESIRGPQGPDSDTKVGDLSTLKTTVKSSAVGAINENYDSITDLKEDFDVLGLSVVDGEVCQTYNV